MLNRSRNVPSSLKTMLGLLAALSLVAPIACSDDSPGARDGGTDTGTTDGTPGSEAGATGGGTIKGVVKDGDGNSVGDATVTAGSLSTTADFKGQYELKNVPAGEVTVSAGAAWFAAGEQKATVKEGEETTLDLTLSPMALKIEDADRTLAEDYNKTYDWTKDTLSITIVAGPTKRAIDNAVWFRNPAMYRDTSGEDKVSPKPSIDGGGKGFDFPVGDKQALDATSIVDSLDKTAVPAGERASWVTWTRLLKVLKDLDITKASPLNNAAAAIRQQQWGGNGVAPQALEQVWLHDGAIWVSVVFEGFVELGSGVSDSDGDGRKEIFAKISGDHYDKDVVDKLTTEYLTAGKLTTLQLKEVMDDVINDLYDNTNPEVSHTIGQPFTVPDKGELAYPFVVLKHADGKQNVLLVGP